MKLLQIVTVIAAIGGLNAGQSQSPLSLPVPCDEQYKRYSNWVNKPHTFCNYKKSPDAKPATISDDDIKFLLEKHNNARKDPLPGKTGINMEKMYWDPNIAKIAQYYAETCPTVDEKDPDKAKDKNRDVPGYEKIRIGQNIGTSSKKGREALQEVFASFYDNLKPYFKLGKGSTDKSKSVLPLKTVLTDYTNRVGCGMADCKGKTIVVCNYAPETWDTNRPFDAGTPCQQCSKRCVDGKLCDNKGKLCFNGGTIHFKSGKCQCRGQFAGESCEQLICWGDFENRCKDASNCKKYKKADFSCPILCGKCSKDCKRGENFFEAPKADLKEEKGATVTYQAGMVKTLPGQEKCPGMKGGSKKLIDAVNKIRKGGKRRLQNARQQRRHQRKMKNLKSKLIKWATIHRSRFN